LTDLFTRYRRPAFLVSLVLGIVFFCWVLYLLRLVILPFAGGLVMAYLLLPFISWLQWHLPPRGKWAGPKRVFAILLSFLIFLVFIGGFSYFLVAAVVDASMILLENIPSILSRSIYEIQVWLDGMLGELPIEMRAEVTQALVDAGNTIGQSIRDALMGSIVAAPRTLSVIAGFAVLPFFLFFLLKDSEKLKRGFYAFFPDSFVPHLTNVVAIVENVLGRYIRSQVMLGIIVAYFSFVGLLIIGAPFAPVLSLVAGICELIPTLGPWIGGGVAAVVVLAIAPEKAVWVILLFLVIQVLENSLLVPRIQSAYMQIHPAVMIILLVLAGYIAGFWGLLLVGPMTATFVEIGKYIRRHYQLAAAGPAEQEAGK